MKLPTNYLLTNYNYIHLAVYKQMINKIELFVLERNARNYLTVCNKWGQARLKMLSTNNIYMYMYIKSILH